MAKTFSIEEIIEMAVKIEENGAAFYKILAELSKNKSAKEIFSYLQGEEKEHAATFQSIYKQMTKKNFVKAFSDEEANAYLHLLVETRMFKNQKDAEDIARRMKNEEEAIDLALDIEKDTLLFYYELIEGVEEGEKEIVKRLIDQEKTHIRRLTTLRQIIKTS